MPSETKRVELCERDLELGELLARVRPCARVRSMWAALGEGESSDGVT